jgi:hypothetical protein
MLYWPVKYAAFYFLGTVGLTPAEAVEDIGNGGHSHWCSISINSSHDKHPLDLLVPIKTVKLFGIHTNSLESMNKAPSQHDRVICNLLFITHQIVKK